MADSLKSSLATAEERSGEERSAEAVEAEMEENLELEVTCLHRYVNRRLRVSTFVRTKEVAKKRWVALCVFSVVFYLDSNDL